MRLFKSHEEKEQIDAARSNFDDFVRVASGGEPTEVKALAAAFSAKPELLALSDRERRGRSQEAFRTYAQNVLADDHLTIDEEMAFADVSQALGVAQQEFENTFKDLFLRMVVARANDGRLSTMESPQLMTKKNEVVHLETAASLLKEVTLREWRGGYSGFSFPIAKGIRYRTGAGRGHSVVVGTEMQVEDEGIFCLTSQRVAYLGSRKTMEVPYAKLMNIDVFTDGVRLHASNRQKAPLFRVESGMGDVIAATLNAAIERFNE
jgi:hypothetical protein